MKPQAFLPYVFLVVAALILIRAVEAEEDESTPKASTPSPSPTFEDVLGDYGYSESQIDWLQKPNTGITEGGDVAILGPGGSVSYTAPGAPLVPSEYDEWVAYLEDHDLTPGLTRAEWEAVHGA